MAVGLLMCVEMSSFVVVANASIRIWYCFFCFSADMAPLFNVVARF